MGTIRHVYTNAVADGTATSVVRPSDWNSGHAYTMQDGVSLSGTNTAGLLAAISSGTLYLAGGNNITLSQDANSLTISGPMGGSLNLSAGTTSNNMTAVTFSNSGGVSFGLDGSVVTATVVTNYQAPGAYLTTAAQVSHSHGNPSLALTNLTGTTASNSAGLTLSLSAGAIPGATIFSNSNNVSFGLNGSTVTATATVAQTNQTLSMAATSNTAGNTSGMSVDARSLTIQGRGDISVGFSTSAGGSSLVVSGSQSVQPVAVSGANGSYTFATLSFSNANGMSFSTSAGSAVFGSYTVPTIPGATVFSNSNNVSFGLNGSTVTATATFAGGGGAAISAAGGSISNGTAVWSNSNNVSFGMNASTITATATFAQTNQSAIKALGASNTGNTAGNTGVSSGVDWVIAGTNAVTISQSTVGGGPNTLWVNAPNAGAGNVTFSAGAASAGLASVVFSNSNGISFGLNGSTITAGGDTISFYRPAGMIITYATAQANSLQSIQPFVVREPVRFSNILFGASVNVGTNTNNSSAFVDMSVSAVIYSRNVSTLSSLTSFGSQYTATWSSNATGTVTGVQMFSATCNMTTLTAGEYYLAVHISTTNTATGGAATTALGNTFSMVIGSSIASAVQLGKRWGAQTANSVGMVGGMGVISTNLTRATIAFSDYTVTGTRAALAPVYFELRDATFQV